MGARTVERESFVALIGRRGRFTVAEPLFERGQRVTLDVRARGNAVRAKVGEMALVRMMRGRGARAEVVRALGRPDVARDVIEALLVDRGHARGFPAAAEQEARVAAASESDGDRRGRRRGPRRDLTDLPVFTIDPAQARDFDDAISVERDGGLFQLSVHIADVAAHVRPGSALDQEALRRANSVYAPGTVEPMLPHVLSSDACSLVPGELRPAVTVEMSVADDGAVSSVAFYRSTIRSDARMDYEQVDRIFAGDDSAPPQVAEQLSRARRLAATLRERRTKRGALGLESSEPEFEFDADGHVVRAIDDIQTEAHGLIEELMILTNEQVALELTRRRLGLLYRVHEQPEPAAIEYLVAQLESLEVPTPPLPKHITPQLAGELVGAISQKVAEHIRRTGRGRAALTSLVLRSLKQAYYSPANIGHAGLASPSYAHFTSPIRRYPDLVVHRSLLAAVGGGEQPPDTHSLSEIGWHCSQTEREAMKLERAADDVCLAFLLERVLFERGWETVFEGEVNGLVGGGAFVGFALEEGGAPCEGFLPARSFGGEYFDLNEVGTAIVGRRTGRQVRLGDRVEVGVRGIDSPRGRVDLVPASAVDADQARVQQGARP